MTSFKCLSGTRHLRMLWIASFFVVGSFSFGPALADDTSLDDSAKKAGNNFGELLKGMGQELKKAGGSFSASGKKDDKKEKKHPEGEPEKDKNDTK